MPDAAPALEEKQAAPAAPAAAQPAGTSESAAPDSWYSKFELNDDTLAYTKRFGDPVAALTAGAQFEKQARERNPLPRPEAGKEAEWSGWKDLGWKEQPEDYFAAVGSPKIPEGFEYHKALEAKVLEAAHAARVPATAAKAILDAGVSAMVADIEAVKSQGALAQEKLRAELQAEKGADYDAFVSLAERAARVHGARYGLGEVEFAALGKALGGDAKLVRFFADLGASMTEDQLKGGVAAAVGYPASRESAQSEVARLRKDSAFMAALGDRSHKDHEASKARWDNLARTIAGGR